jgi:pimeloyl-ACP methyl ester carboxylesterase/uncharacterized protein (DUF952 family)
MVARPDNVLRLPDGRIMGYAQYGDPGGRPLFFFHGFPGSRLEAGRGDEAAERHGVRIIAPDRPGFGLSEFKPRRRIADWPDDVTAVASLLDIDRFAVVGVSGGGPYAAACAARIPDRLTGVAIVSGLGPLDAPAATAGMMAINRWTLALVRRAPWLARLPMAFARALVRRFPGRVVDILSYAAPPADRAVMARPEVRRMFVDDVRESFRQGSRGQAWEVALFARPWGFRLEDIRVRVHLWHGEADTTVPVSMGRYLAKAIPDCRARFYPDEGHLLLVDRIDEVHEALFPETVAAPAPDVTYHLTPADHYRSLPPDAPYVPEPFDRDGFIHCTDGIDNALAVGNAYYRDDPRDYLLLAIDKTKVTAEVRYEDEARIYPHVYGPLAPDAIIAAVPLPRAPDGRFLPPDHVPA